ncbi:glycosyltransferase [Celeribacter indicus]|uniref:Family 2 glycosyl transferase n=1 Tax=Celeribacter indicus TaxID=1208324 RepID=A0A0B5DW97_9RHOB|nr:glycosyltransferase [Celeribacter indicus]AJE45425.1 family 2 glycosyl transferase [Celeribacter indicus]SDX01675.1 rhamnosyltransferase [Celeribacter indicus]
MVALIIPVYNGGDIYRDCLEAIEMQRHTLNRRLVMESGSTDDSRALSLAHGFEVHDVPAGTFNHGGTRSRAVGMVEDDIVVFLTQDAILDSPDSISRLVEPFRDPEVGAAFGRQLPHRDANPLAAHARFNSYGTSTYVTDMDSSYPSGIRKCFLSNSFAAYRRTAFEAVGGFPTNVILSEDMFVAAKILKAGWKVAYAAEATVRHSHNYTVQQEFRRYFDIGVFHRQATWILEEFGRPEAEGVRVTLDQLGFLARRGDWRYLPRAVVTAASKYAGYKLGLMHDRLGPNLSRRLAMHRGFFKNV